MSQLLLGLGLGVINLVTKDNKGNLGKFLHGKEGIELGLDFGESDVVDSIDKEDDTINLGEVISPDTASYYKLVSMASVRGRRRFTYPVCGRPSRMC